MLDEEDSAVLLEGTQGSGLSLTHGIWPWCTSTDTNAAQLCADAGVAPQTVAEVVLVCRTFPIRVAGASGPLANETTWADIGRPEERTTVTKKVRRVGMWDTAMVQRAAMLNRPDWLALTFVDYWDNGAAGALHWEHLHATVRDQVRQIERDVGVPVRMLGTGPRSVVHVPVPVS
jgi:adenylosuccinate synthase